MVDIIMEECFICFEETDQFIIFECSHKVCTQCFPRLRSPLCPICGRSVIPEQITVYYSPQWRCLIAVGAIVVIILWCKRNVIF